MVRIKKQYKQPDGTIIEVEGTESEIEGFEKKQKKQKQQIEETERKKTILYGKDLEEIRKIVREEIAKAPPKTVIEYRYYPNYYNPYWVNPYPAVIPMLNPPAYTWTLGQASTCDSVSVGGGACGTVVGQSNSDCGFTLTTTAATGSGQATSWYAAQNTSGPVSVFNSSETACKVNVGDVGSVGGWSGQSIGKSSNFLMSPRM